MLKKQYLLTPGPTPVPPECLLSMAKPIIHHRTDEFRGILSEVTEGLKYIHKTKNDTFIFASSGTGAMEAAVINLLSPSDKAIAVVGGKFGERWQEICEAYNVDLEPLQVEWGTAISPDEIKKKLKNDPHIRAVFTTLCETSTGVKTDIKSIAEITKNYDAVLVVDAVSALGAEELMTDEWGVDVIVAGSQKGLMTPPGLASICLSEKAYKKIEESKLPKYYFDVKKAKKSFEEGGADTPWTPAVSLIIGLHTAINIIKKEGIDNVIQRHGKLAKAVQEAVKAMNLELLAKDSPSNVVTAVKVPEAIDAQEIVKNLRKDDDIWIAGGQAHLKGKIFRIAHLGYMNQYDMIVAISALEKTLKKIGHKFELGKGLLKAEEILFN
jgi:serine---pyruvate transaminase